MLNPSELATIKAFMGETENIDEYKHGLAVLQLEAGNPLEMTGLSKPRNTENHSHKGWLTKK